MMIKQMLAVALVALLGRTAMAQLTDNNVLHAVPAPAKVVMDGKLDEWDLSGKMFTCPNVDTLKDNTSAYVAMMYDADAIYVGIDWNDVTPMLNNYDPRFDQRFCFHSDSIQLHFQTDIIRQVFGWYYTKGQIPAVCVTDDDVWYGKNPIVYIDGMKELGITQAFTEKKNGKGYYQEMRIPWKAIYKDASKAPKAGDKVKCMLDLVWGPDAGKGWPVAHMMDLVKPGAAHGDWFWNVRDVRGDIILEPKGDLQLPPVNFASSKARPQGPVAVRAEIPADAKKFTLAINDEQGNRVRNLAGDFDPADYTVALTEKSRTVEVKWDLLNDKAKMVGPGNYSVIGLAHAGITATYDMHFYNPGSPSWETRDGTGGWGADHTPPTAVVACGEMIAVAWSGAEGGSGVVGVGPDGKKKWGTLKGTTALAADDEYVYTMTSDFWAKTSGLGRLKKADGAYEPYMNAAGKPVFPLALEDVFGKDKVPGYILAMAVHKGTLALAMSKGKICLLDAATAKPKAEPIDVPWPRDILFTAAGDLVVLSVDDVLLLKKSGAGFAAAEKIAFADVKKPSAIGMDAAGRLALGDVGDDSQVKLFEFPGAKLVGTFGKKGGRPNRGPFDPEAMKNMKGLAFDRTGNLWVVENSEAPRRVSVWGKDGKLVRDYLGNTGYCSVGTYLHDQDPTLAYMGPLEFKLDKKALTATLTQIMWMPDHAAGESFGVGADATTPQRFTSSASGKPREYLYTHNGPHIVLMPCGKNGGWQPVAGFMLVHHVSGHLSGDFDGKGDKQPSGEFEGLKLRDGLIWTDKNGDGKVNRDECAVIKGEGEVKYGHKVDGHGPAAKLALGGYWGDKIGHDLSIYAPGLLRYKPLGFTDGGAPIYNEKSIESLGQTDHGHLVPVDDENKLIVCSETGYGETSYVRAIDLTSKKELWRYPLPCYGVHGSHHAAMPEPGQAIGVIKMLGVAKVSDGAGSVFALRGNLGQDFFLTTDGLYVGAMFHDSRIPSPPFPQNERELVGADLTEASEGSEPFNGWFGRQSDGGIRMCNGMAGLAGTVITFHGFDTIKKFTAQSLTVDQPTLIKAEQQASMKVAAAPKVYTVRKMPADKVAADKSFTLPGPGDYPFMSLGREGTPNYGQARMAYDDKNLYVEYRISDPTPWMNEGKDFQRLFKTGDSCDLQLSVDPASGPHADPTASDMRLVFSKMTDGKPVCVLMKPVDPKAPADVKHPYASPVTTKVFARVEVAADVSLSVKTTATSYTLQVVIPQSVLGVPLKSGMSLRGDAGVIHSDAQGTINVSRTYWSNPSTNLVSDLPHEAALFPAAWGTWRFE